MHGLGGSRLRMETVVAWAVLLVAVLAVYVTVVLGGGIVIDRPDSPHVGLSVLATVIVAAGFDPARTKVERGVARLLHRGRSAPYDVLARFSAQFASAVPAEQLTERMARVLMEGTAAQWAQIWLVVRGQLTLVASYPAGAGSDVAPPPLDLVEPDPQVRSLRVGHGGQALGLLRIKEGAHRPLTSTGERLFAGLGAQAGMVLHSAQLQADLSARLAELSDKERQLRQHREQLVSSQELERRRLERDLHDGAQQQLVALTINLRLAKALLRTSPDDTVELLAEQAVAAEDAIDTLARLSAGAQPRALTEGGLSAALAAAADVSPIPVRLHLADVGRLEPDVEAAAYYCAVEALQNAAKHSRATRIDLELCALADELLLRITDDGRGLPAGPSAGTGLASMQQRAASVNGAVTVRSRPGAGTTVEATLPARRLESRSA
jgi:signal transduction histidine kinase